jgi:hypothetical protein
VADLDGTFGSGPARVNVKGLNRVLRNLEKSGADATDMKDLMHEIGMIVVRAAQPPTRTGRLAGTIRAGRGKTKAVVRAGGARAPYAGVTHYGNPYRNTSAEPFLVTALRRERGAVLDALAKGIEDILRKNDLHPH